MGMHPDSHAQEAYNVESMHFVHVYAAAYHDHALRIIHQLWCSPGQGHSQHEAEEVISSDYSRLKKI